MPGADLRLTRRMRLAGAARLRMIGLAAALLCPACDCRAQPPADAAYDVAGGTTPWAAARGKIRPRRSRRKAPLKRPETAAGAPADPMRARVTIRVKDAPLAAFLDLVASQAGLNFILADGLEGVRVTAFLTDVTARDALELLRVTKGLTYHRVESRGATVIAPASREAPDLRTKVYTLENVPNPDR